MEKLVIFTGMTSKKKTYIIIIIACISLITPLRAIHSGHDSLHVFLKEIGEDSIIISQIMDSPEARDTNWVVDSYLSLLRLKFNPYLQQYEWYPGWEDSLYTCKYARYMSLKIVQDTAINLIGDYLEDAYTKLYTHEYASQVLLKCVEYSIETFHARSGYMIPDLYYRKKNVSDWQKQLQYYDMIKMILLPHSHIFSFDENTNKQLNNIAKENDECSRYYLQFRDMLDSYTDRDLARITEEQREVLVNIILKGVESGEKKSQMTYAFMLLTGLFVDKDDMVGNAILYNSDLLIKLGHESEE